MVASIAGFGAVGSLTFNRLLRQRVRVVSDADRLDRHHESGTLAWQQGRPCIPPSITHEAKCAWIEGWETARLQEQAW